MDWNTFPAKHLGKENTSLKRGLGRSNPAGHARSSMCFKSWCGNGIRCIRIIRVQVVKIRGTIDLALCRRAWLAALEALNLGVVCIAQRSYTHRCLNGEAIYHGVVRCPDGTQLEKWISDELNRPFDADEGVPFRPFVLQEDGFFWMGLCYQHWVADKRIDSDSDSGMVRTAI